MRYLNFITVNLKMIIILEKEWVIYIMQGTEKQDLNGLCLDIFRGANMLLHHILYGKSIHTQQSQKKYRFLSGYKIS